MKVSMRFVRQLINDGEGRGVHMVPPADFLLPWTFFDWLFFEAVGLIVFWGCLEYALIIRKTIENWKLAIHIEIFQKYTCFCPTTTFSRLCSADDTCMKILILADFLRPGVIYSEKHLGSIGHLQKLSKLFAQALVYLKSAMLIYRLKPP